MMHKNMLGASGVGLRAASTVVSIPCDGRGCEWYGVALMLSFTAIVYETKKNNSVTQAVSSNMETKRLAVAP